MIRIPCLSRVRPSRGAAFTIHMILSLLAFSTLVLMMVLFWFPGELFLLDGGWQGLKLVAMVDLVLGPALTLILYKPGKPKLALDLSLIAALQISALAYGFYTTHAQRTVAIVYAENSFNTLSARDHLEANQALASLEREPQSVAPAGILKVPILMTPQPENYGEFLAQVMNGYPEPRARSDLFIPIAEGQADMQSGIQSIKQLKANGTLEAINKALTRRSLAISDIEIYPFKSRYARGMVIFDPQTQGIVDFVPSIPKLAEKQTVVANDELS